MLMVMLQPLAFLIYFISVSAELNRTPADIAEAESEIVGGYHTEYSGMKFGLFYAAELINAVVVSAIIATIFLGGWWLYKLDEIVPGWMIFIGKIYAVYFLFVWTRGTLPRFRIDQLLAFAWKWMTPMAILNIVAGRRRSADLGRDGLERRLRDPVVHRHQQRARRSR